MWFDNWSDIWRVLLVGVASYVFVVASIRLSGKRTLSQLNAFDFVVTVALGSTLATILLSSDVAFAEGALALLLLLVLQVIVAFATSRSQRLRRLVTARPTLLVWKGQMNEAAMRRTRVSHDEIEQAIRQSGEGDLASVGAVCLESNGQLSVIAEAKLGDGSALGRVDRRPASA